MGRAFASGTKAIGYCDRCGFQYLLSELRSEVVNMEETDIKACPECWDPDQPQNQLGRHQFSDPQALRNPRPTGGTAGRGTVISFDFTTSLDDWVAGPHSTLVLDPVNEWAVHTATGEPFIYRDSSGSTALDIDTSIYTRVVMRAKSSALSSQWEGLIRWKRTTDSSYGGIFGPRALNTSNPFTEPVMGDQWHLLEWDLFGVTDWDGTVSGVAFDIFGAMPLGLTLYIDYIRFEQQNL